MTGLRDFVRRGFHETEMENGKYVQGQTKKINIVKRTGVLVYTIK